MEPATTSAPPGTLRINSRPWSQVFIDGRLIGNTPQMAVSVPAGRYTVRLSNPELGMSKTIILQVAAGELVTRVETLE
jgi:serine/threonine-protein kinase